MLKKLLLCVAVLPTWVAAKGVSPYLPLNMSPEVEHHIEKAFALTGNAPLVKPYKAADLHRVLPKLKSEHPRLYQLLSQYLDRYRRERGWTHRSISAGFDSGELKALPNQRGMNSDTHFSLSTAGFTMLTPYAMASVGTRWDDEQGLVHWGTALSAGFEYAQVDIGYREHWFSPMQDGAMLVSTHAKPSPSITVSNVAPITDWQLNYTFFYSKLETVEGIRLGDQVTPGEPRHAGLHISFQPIDNLTLGINRTLQFGGGLREVDFSDVIQAIFNPAGKDNVGDYTGDDPNFEFGNQQASVTARYHYDGDFPFVLYGEIGGEDTEGEKNYKLGNETLSAGLYLPVLTDNIGLRYEFTRWSTAWYVHHLYQQGYTNEGRVMGHWGGSERQFGDDVKAHVHAMNVNWQMSSTQLLDITLRHIQNQSEATYTYDNGIELEATFSQATPQGFWGVTLYTGRSVFGGSFTRVNGFYRW
ncbi:capsule assembly Wzi family protein [Aestuariibacter halophilus]|uniref:Capsule assembly Wzi family protein n=1 Tax=Fluctibacter halophilus TaxID=226011 RepID=A0ABS8GCJ3_9ALTE|nr:capsule assembly Wzi family protein [Aestuariibacter halophilus]MCC2617514.1 capsule assembly Wzi family protein [Aestuariibacter halophilus]